MLEGGLVLTGGRLEGGLVLDGVLLRERMWVCVCVGGRVRGAVARGSLYDTH